MFGIDTEFLQSLWKKFRELYGLKVPVLTVLITVLAEPVLLVFREYTLASYVLMLLSLGTIHSIGRAWVAVNQRPKPAKFARNCAALFLCLSLVLLLLCSLSIGTILLFGGPLHSDSQRLFDRTVVDLSYVSNLFLLSMVLALLSTHCFVFWRTEHKNQVVRLRETPSFVDLFSAGHRLSSLVRLQLA